MNVSGLFSYPTLSDTTPFLVQSNFNICGLSLQIHWPLNDLTFSKILSLYPFKPLTLMVMSWSLVNTKKHNPSSLSGSYKSLGHPPFPSFQLSTSPSFIILCSHLDLQIRGSYYLFIDALSSLFTQLQFHAPLWDMLGSHLLRYQGQGKGK